MGIGEQENAVEIHRIQPLGGKLQSVLLHKAGIREQLARLHGGGHCLDLLLGAAVVEGDRVGRRGPVRGDGEVDLHADVVFVARKLVFFIMVVRRFQDRFDHVDVGLSTPAVMICVDAHDIRRVLDRRDLQSAETAVVHIPNAFRHHPEVIGTVLFHIPGCEIREPHTRQRPCRHIGIGELIHDRNGSCFPRGLGRGSRFLRGHGGNAHHGCRHNQRQ